MQPDAGCSQLLGNPEEGMIIFQGQQIFASHPSAEHALAKRVTFVVAPL